MLSGGLTAQVLVGVRGPYADGAFALGASVGMVAGPAVQVLHVLLLAVLRLRFPRPSARWGRLALLVLPVTSACALTAWLGDGVPTAASAVLVAGSTTAVLTWLVVPWCSAPLEAELR